MAYLGVGPEARRPLTPCIHTGSAYRGVEEGLLVVGGGLLAAGPRLATRRQHPSRPFSEGSRPVRGVVRNKGRGQMIDPVDDGTEDNGMSRSYRVVAVATAVFAALLTASVFLWLSARANASETKSGTKSDGEASTIKDVRVVTIRDDGSGDVVVSNGDDTDSHTRVYVVSKGEDSDSAFLGVQLSEETKYKDGGARVDEVVSDSPAEKAGLKEGDIIVGFAGQPIHGPMRLSESIHAAKPGDKIDIDIVRGGAKQKIQVEMGERPKSFPYWYGDDGKGFAPLPEGQFEFHNLEGLKELEGFKDMPGMFQWRMFGNRPKLGIRIVDTTPDLREHLGGPRDAGILVGKVMTGMPAEKAGVKVGDILVSVDGNQVEGTRSLIEALQDKDGKTVDLEVIRDRKTMHLKATLPEAKEEG